MEETAEVTPRTQAAFPRQLSGTSLLNSTSNHFLRIDCRTLIYDLDRFHLTVVVRICRFCATGFHRKMPVGEKILVRANQNVSREPGGQPMQSILRTVIMSINRVRWLFRLPTSRWVGGNGVGCQTKFVRPAPNSLDKPTAKPNGAARHAPRLEYPKPTGSPARQRAAHFV